MIKILPGSESYKQKSCGDHTVFHFRRERKEKNPYLQQEGREHDCMNDGSIKIDTYLILYITAWVVTLFYIFQIAVNA
jgi:hypothetical protein